MKPIISEELFNKVKKIYENKQKIIAPFGYDYVNGKLIVNEKEANVVRKLYKLYIRKSQIDNMVISTKYKNKKWRLSK